MTLASANTARDSLKGNPASATTPRERLRFNGHELVADVLNDVQFKDGIRVTDDDTTNDEMTDEKVAA